MTVSINSLPVHVIKSSRKTVSIELKTDEIIVRAPKRMCDDEIQAIKYKKTY